MLQATLNCLSPTVEPKATDYIPHMVAMIEQIIRWGGSSKCGSGSPAETLAGQRCVLHWQLVTRENFCMQYSQM